MKSAWTILLITALTTASIGFGTGFTALVAETKGYPSGPGLVALAVGALVLFSQTILQALKAKPADIAELKGIAVTEITKTPGSTIIAGPAERMAEQVERSSQHVLPQAGPSTRPQGESIT